MKIKSLFYNFYLLNQRRIPWKICMLLLVAIPAFLVSFTNSYSQEVTLKLKNERLVNALESIKKQSGTSYIINGKNVANLRVNTSLKDVPLDHALNSLVKDLPVSWILKDETIVISPAREKSTTRSAVPLRASEMPSPQETQQRAVVGQILDEQGNPISGVTVSLKDSKEFTVSNKSGEFLIPVNSDLATLELRCIGFNTSTIQAKSGEYIYIELKSSELEVSEVVVTGIYERPKDSFTGSATTYSQKELKEVGVQNVLQSLKTLDPAFNLMENNQFGSDPNRLPDIEIRGKTSIVGLKEQFGEDPNQPLFILDGFETTLQTIVDLSLDRVASVTVLKDAASTAIYGAKAANGVVVIETKVPEGGKMRVSFNSSADLSFPDLNDYNLMNAQEKLEFEYKAGGFKSNLSTVEQDRMFRYYQLEKDIKRGVDTYWLAEPLRTGINQRNNLYLEGGAEEMRYGFGVNNNAVQGVMKNSFRKNLGGAIDFVYRKGKLSFMNKFTLDHNSNSNPVVDFSAYSRANPYYRKYNENGGVDKWLEEAEDSQSSNVANPLWDDALNSRDVGNSLGFRNNFNLEYRPVQSLNIRARAGINRSNTETEEFHSPDATRFEGVDVLKKGSYTTRESESTSYQGDISVTFGKLLNNRHMINVVGGASINQTMTVSKGFEAEGFPEGDFTTPAFSNAYPEGAKPSYSDAKRRNVGFFINTGYSLNNKYLVDLNLRSDGTSVFGSNKLFSTTWSAGLAWNIHEEEFIKNLFNDVNMLKIRGSVGNPGNQNFGTFNALTTYKFNNWLQNNFGTGLYIDAFGDPNLEWQKTLDKNIGLDVSALKNRLHLNVDVYHKNTDPLLASVGIPLSVGISSRLMNVGMQVDKGVTGTLRYAIIYKPQERKNWTASISFRHGTAYYNKIGNRLDSYNRENLTKNLSRYYDGASPTALWSVVSKGIDPATGREIFQNLDGDMVYTHSFNDEVEVGDSRPILEGVLGNTFYWNGFSANLHIRYSYGGDMFNSTLYSKVENISSTEILRNQDRRALYNRWQNVGDIAEYKGISLTEQTPISSRFVQKNNYISFESVRIGYELNPKWLDKLSISYLQLNAYMNDIARIGSIKNERGIDYPFARSISFGLNVNF